MVREKFIDEIRAMVGRPYIWGGQSGDGVDCSGLVIYCLDRAGLTLTDTTAAGLYTLTSGNQRQHEGEYLPGDLVFYTRKGTNYINHIMVLLDIWGFGPFQGVVVGSRGGGSSTTSIEEAYRRGAMVSVRPFTYRASDIFAVTSPFDIGA